MDDILLTGPAQRQAQLMCDVETLVSVVDLQNDELGDSSNEDDQSGIAWRGSIAERRAAKCGFKAERINPARFRTTSPLVSPSAFSARSPCITIPPGISPAALLDSPILLPNSLSSPTTGTFPLPVIRNESSMSSPLISVDSSIRSNFSSSQFRFMVHANPEVPPDVAVMENLRNMGSFQDLVPVQSSMEFEFPVEAAQEEHSAIRSGNWFLNSNVNNMKMCSSSSNETSVQRDCVGGDGEGTQLAAGRECASEDGFNWRKYGQKPVKGSEYPRSYFKCTHPNCQVKKKIERSHDGHITEIIYKGAHNHPEPHPVLQSQPIKSAMVMNEMVDGGVLDIKLESGLERTSSTSVLTDHSDPLSNNQILTTVGKVHSADTTNPSSTFVSQDDDDDGITQGNFLLEIGRQDEESESKRRKMEYYPVETNLPSRSVREPRVVVQIESEIDVLDDGYRWRKYGQKVVKGNPNPRSYYKCTSIGCTVRKHVERASHDLKYVITTYEGKHNHEVPAARSSSSSTGTSAAGFSQAAAISLARQTNIPKPEPGIQAFSSGFHSRQGFDEYFRHMTPLCSSKLPSMQNPMNYSSFGLDPNHLAANPLMGPIPPFLSDLAAPSSSILYPFMNLPRPGADLVGHGRQLHGQVPQFVTTNHLTMKPKQEQVDHDQPDRTHQQPIMDNNAPFASSSLYILESFPS